MSLLFGTSGFVYAGVLVLETIGVQLVDSAADRTMGLLFPAIVLPWTVFALRYVGRGALVTQRRITVAVGLILCVVGLESIALYNPFNLPTEQRQLLSVTSSVLLLSLLAIGFAAMWLVLSTSRRHDRFTWREGLLAVAPVAIPLLVFQTTRPATPRLNDILARAGLGLVAVVIWVGIFRRSILSDRPGTGTLGERAAVHRMDEAVFVVDRDGRVARVNPAAEDHFGTIDAGVQISEVTDFGVEALTERETIRCQTTSGQRQFDPRITELRNDRDELLGLTITLFDVTDREIRQQRLQVLNRVLRHNLRNRLDVIKAHAEETQNTPIVQSADQLHQLSTEARRLETLMQRSEPDQTEALLHDIVNDVVADVTDSTAGTETSVTLPAVTLDADPRLCRYAIEQLVENAIEHSDGTPPRVEITGSRDETGVEVVIADDGPGIPQTELDVIESGTEEDLAHASSFGLWGANWAIKTVGGTLDFEPSHLGGTAAVIELPS
jgi:signal transduction histidine kinase